MNLNELPNEIFQKIQRHLNVKDVFRLSNVSPQTRAKINWKQVGLLSRDAYVEPRKAVALAPLKTFKLILHGDKAFKKAFIGKAPYMYKYNFLPLLSSYTYIDFFPIYVKKHKVHVWDLAGIKPNTEMMSFNFSHADIVVILASSQDELHQLNKEIVELYSNSHIVLAHPEGVKLDTTRLKINAVFPFSATNCTIEQLAFFALQSLLYKPAEETKHNNSAGCKIM
jgi:hypothetical protein